MDHEGKVALVVGASMGIGQAICRILADEGCDIACAARSTGKLQETAAQVQERGRKALAIPCDVRDDQAVSTMVSRTLEAFGKIDILVYAAGGPLAGVRYEAPKSNDDFFPMMMGYAIGTIQPSDWEAIFDINFYGGKRCIEAVLPHMKERDSGHILLVTSKAALMKEMIVPGFVPYATAKAAITRYMEGVAFELTCEASEVKANAFNPGLIVASMHDALPEDELDVYGKPDDVKDVVLKVLREGESGEIYSAGSLKTWAEEIRDGD